MMHSTLKLHSYHRHGVVLIQMPRVGSEVGWNGAGRACCLFRYLSVIASHYLIAEALLESQVANQIQLSIINNHLPLLCGAGRHPYHGSD